MEAEQRTCPALTLRVSLPCGVMLKSISELLAKRSLLQSNITPCFVARYQFCQVKNSLLLRRSNKIISESSDLVLNATWLLDCL